VCRKTDSFKKLAISGQSVSAVCSTLVHSFTNSLSTNGFVCNNLWNAKSQEKSILTPVSSNSFIIISFHKHSLTKLYHKHITSSNHAKSVSMEMKL